MNAAFALVQSLLVLAFSVAFNASRWFELKFGHVTEYSNATAEFNNNNASQQMVNRTFVVIQVSSRYVPALNVLQDWSIEMGRGCNDFASMWDRAT